MVQQVLVYLILLLAVGYLVHRFIFPIPLFVAKKKSNKDCGSDCGCA
jgi:membrane-anchored glycerophosphoryl diester phosphodiesterase (GDPDase)